MALNIKNQDVEHVLAEIVQMTGESKTEAVRKALEERRQRLALQNIAPHSEARLLVFLTDELWPSIPAELRGTRLSKHEEESVLGYGDQGI